VLVEPWKFESFPPEDRGHVMTSLQYTLDNMTLVGFDPSDWAQRIEVSAARSDKVYGREKPVFATVRGSGGGKTRAFTEIRRELLKRSNIMVLMITFNSKWDVSAEKDVWPGVTYPDVSYALSVVSRMAAMFFGCELRVTHKKMKKSITKSATLIEFLEKDESGSRIIAQFIVWMIYRIRQYRPSVDTFILLADEVVKMEKLIKKRFNGIEDITSVLRQALLEDRIMIRPPFSTDPAVENSVLKIALALSSLETNSIGESISNRPIVPIILPAALDSKEVVSKIWAPSINSRRVANQEQELLREEQFQLELVASTINSIPRLVEYANTYFVDETYDEVNNVLVFELLNYLNNCIVSDPTFPTSSVLRAIIFNQEIPLSDPGLKLSISVSVVTNSVTVFNEEKNLTNLQTSILTLNKAASATTSEIGKSVHKGLTNILESLRSVNTKNLGSILEILVYNWLKIRLDVAAATFAEGVSLATIFALEPDMILLPEEWYPLLEQPLKLGHLMKSFILSIDSHFDQMGSRLELENIQVTRGYPVVLIQPTPKESYDVGLKVLLPDRDTPVYIFIELKSRDVVEGRVPNRIQRQYKGPPPSQYYHTATVMDGTEFLYIFMSTRVDESRTVDRCILLGQTAVYRFMGQVKGLYEALRGATG